ncbi:unnamed protein product [Lymnaea stagnalis]|uniref:Uncharacterized protein n=1 Tax=Lymnaea stagnalis TaxID=6523 RepID=A0AAV2I2B2_LYMST
MVFLVAVVCICLVETAFGAVEIVNGRCPYGKKAGDKWHQTECRECFCETGKWACIRCRDLNVGHDRSQCYNIYLEQTTYPACCVATLKCRGEPGFSEIRLFEELHNITTKQAPMRSTTQAPRKPKPIKVTFKKPSKKIYTKKPSKKIHVSLGRDKKKKYRW